MTWNRSAGKSLCDQAWLRRPCCDLLLKHGHVQARVTAKLWKQSTAGWFLEISIANRIQFSNGHWQRYAEIFAWITFHEKQLMPQTVLYRNEPNFGTRKAEVLNSLVMKITANVNDTNDILQTFR